MHQTFYIDVEEEISSVIEKLRKSSAVENYFVVTKRALVVQSIVNLKLLKREAEKLKKSIVIVTADEQTMRMAERAGIDAQASLEGLDFVEENGGSSELVEASVEPDFAKQKKKRLVAVGSSDYYGGASERVDLQENRPNDRFEEEADEEEEIVVPTTTAPRKMVRRMDDFKKNIDHQERSMSDGIRKPQPKTILRTPVRRDTGNYDLKESFESFLDPDREKKFDKLFQGQPQKPFQQERKYEPVINRSGSGKNLTFVFVLAALLLFAGVAAYLFIPKAEVVVYLDVENKQIASSVTADINQQTVDVENLKIPARIIEKESEIMLSYEATGAGESAGSKAKGTLVIYNEYNTSVQPLIATTRFETEDGKIFRLIKGVSVPGMSNVSGVASPGAIEVEVVADMPGESYNIEPSPFKIPGFKGTDKYDKIYAKSAKGMTGGVISGDSAKIVSQADIDTAKQKTEQALGEKIRDLLKSELDEGEMVVSQTSKLDIADSVSFAKVGDLKSSFDYQVKAKMSAFVVSEKDMKEIAAKVYRDSAKKSYEYALEGIEMEIGSAESDFENKKSTLKTTFRVAAKPVFDSEGFRKKLAAKDEDQVREIMKSYPQIKNLEISSSFDFLSTTPRFDSRINLEIRDFQGN